MLKQGYVRAKIARKRRFPKDVHTVIREFPDLNYHDARDFVLTVCNLPLTLLAKNNFVNFKIHITANETISTKHY